MRKISAFGKPVLINGGDEFVSRVIKEKKARKLFSGVNQEEVFTRIDFSNNTYHAQYKNEVKYFQSYLANVRKAGLSVYLLEYHANKALSKRVSQYCRNTGAIWYNAPNLSLDSAPAH